MFKLNVHFLDIYRRCVKLIVERKIEFYVSIDAKEK